MIARVAQGCFWLTRYLERVDNLARALGVHHGLHIDAGVGSVAPWQPLLRVTGQEEDFVERAAPDLVNDGEAVQRYLTWEGDQPSSLYSSVCGARENARTVREVMSLETWEAINDLWLWMNTDDSRRLYEQDRSAFYEHLVQSTVLFHGVSHATMLHDEPFTFMKLGRAVERAGQTARILDAHVESGAPIGATAEDAARWVAALRSCCAYDPFFRSSKYQLGGRSVATFLLLDRVFPRSVLYCLDECRSLLYQLRQGDPDVLPRRSREALERVRGELLQMNADDVEHRGVHATLTWLVDRTSRLCDAIDDDYLAPPFAWLRHCVRVLETNEPRAVDRAA